MTEGSPALTNALTCQPEAAETQDGLHVAVEAGAVILTITRPEAHNALHQALWRRLREVVVACGNDPSTAVMVLRGAGGRAFSAGADISEFPDLRHDLATATSYNADISAALQAVMDAPVPVLAMIDGLAVGGGLELAAACDLRIASDRSRFGIPVGQLGVILGLTETRALTRHTGPHNLKYLLLSGRVIDAAEALRRGIVDEVVAADALADTVAGLVENIRRSSRTTMQAAKLVTDMATRQLTDADVERIAALTSDAYEGADLREGVAAFLAKRRPEFGGSP